MMFGVRRAFFARRFFFVGVSTARAKAARKKRSPHSKHHVSFTCSNPFGVRYNFSSLLVRYSNASSTESVL